MAQSQGQDNEPDAPRLFRISSFAERKKAFERVKNVLAKKIPSRYPWSGWTSRRKPDTLSTDRVVYSTAMAAATSRTEEPQRHFTAELAEDDDFVIIPASSSSGRTTDGNTTLPRPIGDERAVMRSTGIIQSQVSVLRSPRHDKGTTVPLEELSLPSPLDLPCLEFYLADGWVDKQAQLHPAPSPIPDREFDEIVLPHKRKENLPWSHIQRPSVNDHDASPVSDREFDRLERGIYWKNKDKNRPVAETEEESLPAEVHIRNGVQSHLPTIHYLPNIPPASPLYISFDMSSNPSTDNLAVQPIEESVKKVFRSNDFLTVPDIPRRHHRWSHASRRSVSSTSDAFGHSPGPFAAALPDVLVYSDCGDSMSESSDDGFFSDVISEAGSALHVEDFGMKSTAAVENLDFDAGEGTEAVMNAHVKTWLGAQYWGEDAEEREVAM